MHKTIYIDPEDEITAIVIKIRHEAADEIFLVIPRNAMLVQGVINLEILRREAERVNKNITFITNDKQTKALLERLELNVRDGSEEDFVNENVQIEEETDFLSRTPSDLMKQANMAKKAEEIGSGSFYENNIVTEELKNVLNKEGNNISQVRKKERPFNRFNTQPIKREQPFLGNIASGEKIVNKSSVSSILVKEIKKPSRGFSHEENFSKNISSIGEKDPRFEIRQEEAKNFFSTEDRQETKKKTMEKRKTSAGKGIKFIFALIILFLILGGAGSWIFINFPKVSVIIHPKSEIFKNDFEVLVFSRENQEVDEFKIAGLTEEIEISHELRFDATGEKSSSDKGKARGKIRIINNYSSASQPLIATTRVLSENGKLFRLIENVTVPGMKDKTPGEIEVKVIADEPGSEFNIEASKFTIEGFEGSPKYEKFEVISGDKMEGGLDNVEDQKVKIVVQSDIENARSKVIDSFNNIMEMKIKEKIGQGKSFLIDSIEKEIIESVSSLEAGDIGDQFSYRLKQKIRLISFKDTDVKQLAVKNLEKKISDGLELDNNRLNLSYEKSNSDFEKGELKFKVLAESIAWPEINYQEIKSGLASKNEEEITSFLQEFSFIKKAEVKFSPTWLSFLPVTEGKVIIEEIK